MKESTKNMYSISFFSAEEKVLFLEYVDKIDKAVTWINDKKITWSHANVYNRKSREFIKRIYPDNY